MSLQGQLHLLSVGHSDTIILSQKMFSQCNKISSGYIKSFTCLDSFPELNLGCNLLREMSKQQPWIYHFFLFLIACITNDRAEREEKGKMKREQTKRNYEDI